MRKGHYTPWSKKTRRGHTQLVCSQRQRVASPPTSKTSAEAAATPRAEATVAAAAVAEAGDAVAAMAPEPASALAASPPSSIRFAHVSHLVLLEGAAIHDTPIACRAIALPTGAVLGANAAFSLVAAVRAVRARMHRFRCSCRHWRGLGRLGASVPFEVVVASRSAFVPWSAGALIRQLTTGVDHLIAHPAVLVTPVRAVLAWVQRWRGGRRWRR